MTRLSDLLRGAADRAPIGEASVSIQKAHRGVLIQRSIRGAANGLAGAGAAALVFIGVVNPALTGKQASEDLALAPNPASEGGNSRLDGPEAASDFYAEEWGACGSYLDTGYQNNDGSLALAVNPSNLIELEGGATLDIPTHLIAARDLTVTTPGPEAVLLYEGLVVARLDTTDAAQVHDLAVGGVVDSTLSLPLVNCFDEASLPAAKYELVVSQAFSFATDEPSLEPTPVPAPTIEPTPVSEPTVSPEPTPELPPVDTFAVMTGDETATDRMPVEPGTWWDYREQTPSVSISIAGDPIDDPFGDYIWSPPEQPEDLLTPEGARELYEAGLVSGTWDMAPGTSRWIMPNNESYASVDSMRMTSPGWYGCGWNGTAGISFPTESAVLDLLDVSVTFPSRINLSYGWVVDGNPQVHFTVTNTSEYSLPGFYGEPSHSLYLVKNGQVIAEAWPQNIRPYTNDRVFADESPTEPDEYWGTLSPGAALTGDYLWRDLNGCWTEAGPRSVTSGTYTLVTSQSVYIDGSSGDHPILYRELDDPKISIGQDGAPIPVVDPGTSEDEMIVDPAIESVYTYDWVELQVWISLGTVTITTS